MFRSGRLYHELTTLRRVYFERAALANKPVLALLIHNITRGIHC